MTVHHDECIQEQWRRCFFFVKEEHRARARQQEHEEGARTHSRPGLNQKREILHAVNYKQYKFGIPLNLYPTLLKF